ncbi:hypothetical protein V2J09_011971 [Rumex salicifolius]
MASILFLLLLSILICNYCHICWGSKLPIEFGFDSIYQFGDSVSDTGNLMTEIPLTACSHNPYGETYFHKPTGRCSDGLLIVDYFAQAFDLPLLNPYLKKGANFSHGVNFAVAGATALTASKIPISSLSDQLEWFHAYIKSACSSPSDCKHKFKNALFLVGEIGENDYNYVLMDNNKSIPNAYNLVPDVIQSIKNAVKDVIYHGAIHVVVPGNFPIGCMPVFRTAFESNDSQAYDDLGCVRSLNELAKFHNRNLKQALKELQIEYPSVKIHYGDFYSGSTYVLYNAASLGFDKDKLFEPCCGNLSHPCGSDASVCDEPSKRMSWDGTHPTQEAYMNLAEWLLANTFNQTKPSPSPSLQPSQKASQAHVLFRVVAASVLAFWAIQSHVDTPSYMHDC